MTEENIRTRRSKPRRPTDPRLATIGVDTMIFDPKLDAIELEAGERLIQLQTEEILMLYMPYSVEKEIAHDKTPRAQQLRAYQTVYSFDLGQINPQNLARVKAILRGNAQSDKHDADATHIAEAAGVWQARYFVTCDNRIHKKAEEIRSVYPDLFIVRPTELLAILADFEIRIPDYKSFYWPTADWSQDTDHSGGHDRF